MLSDLTAKERHTLDRCKTSYYIGSGFHKANFSSLTEDGVSWVVGGFRTLPEVAASRGGRTTDVLGPEGGEGACHQSSIITCDFIFGYSTRSLQY